MKFGMLKLGAFFAFSLAILLSASFVFATEKDLFFSVEPGTRRVKIETLDDSTGEWSTHRMLHLPGRASQVKLRLPQDVLQNFRVLASDSDPFPFAYYKGRKAFRLGGKKIWETKHDWSKFDAGIGRSGLEAVSMDTTATTPEASEDTQEDNDSATNPQAVESDIWKIEGNTLYFFNQNRGLQIYDLTTPWKPERLAYLRMPALGEQMYVLDDQRVVLLLRRPRELEAVVPGDKTTLSNSEVVVVDWSKGAAEVLSRTSLPGKYLESRMVGRRLYAVCNSGGYSLGGSWRFLDWESSLSDPSLKVLQESAPAYLSTLDLTFPAAPVIVDEKPLPTRAREVAATGTHFLVVRDIEDDWYSSRDLVDVFRIYDDLPPEQLGTAQAGGRIKDKFKMQVYDGTLTTVSQAYGERWNWRSRHTLVETFKLPVDGELLDTPLDSVSLAKNETLRATRFDGFKLYVVTFLQIDPLFVVDLVDPQNIQVHGELEIPGWSTYLIPRGDRLLSVGVENTQVAVSIFDVSDPGNPTMADRIFLGEPGQYTRSEANWDEKAVGYFPEEDVLLVPYETWDWDWDTGRNSYNTAIQKIEIVGDDLRKAGQVSHEVRARRATMLGSLLASISGEELLVADLRDPDKSSIIAREQLSWPVHEVYRIGDYQLELEKSYQSDKPSVLRLIDSSQPETVVQQLSLPEGVLMDTTWQASDSRLVCLVRNSQSNYVYYDNSLQGPVGLDDNRSFIVANIDCSIPGQVSLINTTEIDLSENLWTIDSLDFFYEGSGWLGVCVKGHPPLALTTSQWSEDWLYYETKLAQMLLSLEILPDGSIETLSSAIDFSLPQQYTTKEGLVLAEDRWLFSQDIDSQLRVYDFEKPQAPRLLSTLEIPSHLQLVGANQVFEGSAALYFTTSNYHHWRFDIAVEPSYGDMIWPNQRSSELFAALYDGAELYFLDDSLSDLDFESAIWGSDHILLKQEAHTPYYYYPLEVSEKIDSSTVGQYQLDSQGKFTKIAEWEFPGNASNGSLKLEENKIFVWDHTFLQWADMAEAGSVPQWRLLPQGPFMDFHRAWYEPGKGFYVPVNQYGVEFVPIEDSIRGQLNRRSGTSTAEAWTEIPKLDLQIQEISDIAGPTIPDDEDWTFQPILSYLELGQAVEIKDGQEGWYELGQFGRYYTEYHPWVYHENLGWLYLDESGEQDGFWSWRTSGGQGWLWTSAETYPFCFSAVTDSWVYFYEIPGIGLWRYDFASNSWLVD